MPLVTSPRIQVLDANGNPYVGALLYIYATGTSTPVVTYFDAAFAVPNTNPMVSDSKGFFGPIYAKPELGALKFRVTDALGNSLNIDVDPAYSPLGLSDLSLSSNQIAGLLNAFQKTPVEEDAEITPSDYSYLPYDVRRYGVDPTQSDVTAALQAVASKLPYLWFPAGTYRITSTIQRLPFSRWVGEIPQSNENGSGGVTSEVVIYGTFAHFGSGNPLVRLCVSNTAGSSFVTENISFQSDLVVDTSDLASTSASGVVGVNIDHAKNGTEFINCSWRNLKSAVVQSDTDPYADKVTFSRCHFTRCYLAVDADPTAGMSFVDCFLYDCYDWVQSTTDVSFVNCSLNNSSAGSETCGILAAIIKFQGGWLEGGNNVFQPSRLLELSGTQIREMQSGVGSKYLIKPQGNNCTLRLLGFRVPTNTRMINFDNVSDNALLHVETVGLQDGVNFGNTADINTYLDASLDYQGFGNQNSDKWNTRNPRNPQSSTYAIVRSDAGKLLYHNSATTPTWTIPANASIAFPLNTVIDIVNESGSGAITLAITSDTLRWQSSTGSRSLAANAVARLRKVSDTVWRLTGEGIS